jgi:hypothetical protein
MRNHIFSTHLHRMITNPALYFGISVQALGIVLLCFGKGVYVVDEAVMYMSDGAMYLYILFFMALPPIAYAMTGTEDKNTRMLYFYTIRAGAGNYAVTYYITTLCSGFLMTFCGLGLGVLIGSLLGFYPHNVVHEDFAFIADQYGLLLYYAVRIGDLALGSAVVAGVASAAAAFFRNKVTVLTFPVIVFMMLSNFFSYDHMLLNKSKLILANSYAPREPGLHLLLHLWMCAVWWVVCGFITVRHIEGVCENG